MGDVIHLKTDRSIEYCLQCGCGSQYFMLMFGGVVECSKCRNIIATSAWIHLPPEILDANSK